MSPSIIKAKKKAPASTELKAWLRLPVRPESTERQSVTLYMPKERVDLTKRVRGLQRDMGIDDAATITIDILDPVGALASLELLDADEDMLLDGIDIRWGSVWWRIARLERSDDGWSIIAQDRAAALLQAHKRPMKASRNDVTRAGFAYQLVRGVKAYGGIVAYIPELRDKQKIAKAEQPDDATARSSKTVTKVQAKSASAGWGTAGSKVRIKGRPADATQLRTLNAGLAQAQKDGANRRVMMAVDMAMTQESEMGKILTSVSGLHHGPLHQSDAWGSDKSTAGAVHAFLTIDKGPGVQGWKAKYGSLHSASGNLGQMIDGIQIAGTPKAFGDHEREAAANVDLWLGRNGGTGSTTTSTSQTKTEYYTAQFAFKTSDTDENVNWWEAIGQLANDVKWHRWAAGNTFGYASDDELIRGTPVLNLSRTDKAVVKMPWTWDVRREAASIVVSLLLEDEWQLLPGMTVMVDDEAPISGRWIVESISDTPREPNSPVDVTLRRRNAKAVEPASTVVARAVMETKKETGVGGKSSYGGTKRIAADSLSGTPKDIIDQVVLPVARKLGINVTAASVAAANARHGPTVNGTRSQHQGPPAVAWAADMSNGSSPNPQMDALANKLADMFGLTRLNMHTTGRAGSTQTSSGSRGGYRFQLIYRSRTGGDHDNHVHFGIGKL